MTEWVDVFVYGALAVTVWVLLPLWSARFTVPVIADRNPEWPVGHPEVVRRLTRSRWFVWSCFAWAAVTIAVLLLIQTDVWRAPLLTAPETPKWEILKDVNSTLMIVGVVYLAACTVLFMRWLNTSVPLAERRQAALERRTLEDFVPAPFRIATYALIGLHIAAWAIVAVLQLYSTPAFWGRFAFVVGMTAVFLFLSRLGVHRRPSAVDRLLGPAYRRVEVRFGFAIQLLPLSGLVRLYEEVTQTIAVDVNRALHLMVPIVVVLWFLRLATLPAPGPEPPPASGARTVASVLALALVAGVSP